MELFISLSLVILMGGITGYFARDRGRDPAIWFVLGVLFGIFALLLLFLLPKSNESIEKEQSVQDPLLDYKRKEWYYVDQTHIQQGPIPFYELKRLFKEGIIEHNTLVWSEGMSEWRLIRDLPGLEEDFNTIYN